MSGLGGILTGALGLAILDRVVSDPRANGGFAALAEFPGSWARKFISPEYPLIPNISHAKCSENGDMGLIDAFGGSGSKDTGTGGAVGGVVPNGGGALGKQGSGSGSVPDPKQIPKPVSPTILA